MEIPFAASNSANFFNHSGSDSPKLASLGIVLRFWVSRILIPRIFLRGSSLGSIKHVTINAPFETAPGTKGLVDSLPYLSFVTVARNDNYGGNQRRRLQISVGSLLEQLERYHIESELILVDWNPPPEQPPLRELIDWPTGLEYCTVRAITVGPSIHRRYTSHRKRPFVGVPAVNTGIRRARGQFVLHRVSDVLYSEELVAFLAAKHLKPNELYRVNRCDVGTDVLGLRFDTLEERLEFCSNNVTKEYGYFPGGSSEIPQLHTNGCGDFQLLSRSYWDLLRGYWEMDGVTGLEDGLLSYASYAAGVKEVVLSKPLVVYKISHGMQFTHSVREVKPYFKRLLSSTPLPATIRERLISVARRVAKLTGYETRYERDGVPILSSRHFFNICRDMIAGRRSYVLNHENWGLGGENLPEVVVSKAKWDRELPDSLIGAVGD